MKMKNRIYYITRNTIQIVVVYSELKVIDLALDTEIVLFQL